MSNVSLTQETNAAIPEHQQKSSVLAGRVWQAFYGISDQALAVGGMFLANVALARVRSKEEYGAFALCYSIYTFLSGLHNAVIVEPFTVFGSGRYHKYFQSYARFMRRKNALVCAGISGLLFVIWLILRWLVPGSAIPVLLGMALSSGFLLTGTFIRRIFYVERRPDRAAIFSFCFFIVLAVLVWTGIRAHWLTGFTTFIAAAIAWGVAVLCITRVLPGRHVESSFQQTQSGYWSEHWKYSMWVLATAFVFQLMTQGYYWLVAGFLSIKDLAGLRAIHLLVLPVDQLFAAFTLLILPAMARCYSTGQHSELVSLWGKYSLLFLGVTSVFGAAVFFMSLPLLHLVYGGKFDDLSQLLALLAFVPLVMGVGTATNVALKAAERPRAVFFAYVASGLVTFLAGIPLVIDLGLRGAVYGMLSSAAAYTVTLLALWMSFLRRGSQQRTNRDDETAFRITIIEPVWTGYRHPVYRELSQHAQVDWIFSPSEMNEGFGKVLSSDSSTLRYIEMPLAKPFGRRWGFLQRGLVRYLCFERPDVVMASADPTYLSFWSALVLGRLLNIPVYAHGHGVFKKTKFTWAYRRMINTLLSLSAGYIAYSSTVRDAFIENGFSGGKVFVAENSLINPFPVLPEEKNGDETGVLFLGRLRPGCGVDILLGVVKRLREEDRLDVELHIIGSGSEEAELRQQSAGASWIHWYGEIYDSAKIRDISKVCFAGCYPGNAGLSVVHMMSLSLPVVAHSTIRAHQGPEPGYIKDGENGFLFDRSREQEDMYRALHKLTESSDRRFAMASSASSGYAALTNPTLANRLWRILGSGRSGSHALLGSEERSPA